MKATIVAAICGCALLGFAAESWSATLHARPYRYGPLEKCLSRRGFQFVRYPTPVNNPGVAGKSAWYTRDKHDMVVIVMVSPARARYLRHRVIADLAREWHMPQARVRPGVGRRGNVVWQSFRLTTRSTPPIATTPADRATIAACLRSR